MEQSSLTIDEKALRLNLDSMVFGTFAEIGAGQEVARCFFKVGAASGTVAKTMSAYDMTFSDEIYGKVGRYVSRDRLLCMLQHEYALLLERLAEQRGAQTTFFAFADTVAARNYTGTNECHGWMGVRFQTEPLSRPSEIILHVRMTDRENVLQQQALGIVGVNLMYGAFYLRRDPDALIESLLDGLSRERIEADMVEFGGPAFSMVDNRLMALKLVQHGLTPAAMFAPDGQVLQPSEILRKRAVLVERGSFYPVTHVNVDMVHGARNQFLLDPALDGKDPVTLFELTVNDLAHSEGISDENFIARADTLSALGNVVMISDFSEYYRLVAYFRRYTKEPIALAVGINSMLAILNDRFYEDLEGGVLEALGRLFKTGVRVYVYPMARETYLRHLSKAGLTDPALSTDLPEIVTAADLRAPRQLRHLYQHLLDERWVEPLQNINLEHITIFADDVLKRIKQGDRSWEDDVPAPAAAIIKQRRVFSV